MRRAAGLDEWVINGRNRAVGVLGSRSSSLTLVWLASHRDRLWTLMLGGKRLSVLVIWDTKGATSVPERDEDEVEAMCRIVYGPKAAEGSGVEGSHADRTGA